MFILEIEYIMKIIYSNLKSKLHSFPLDSIYGYLERDDRGIYNESLHLHSPNMYSSKIWRCLGSDNGP